MYFCSKNKVVKINLCNISKQTNKLYLIIDIPNVNTLSTLQCNRQGVVVVCTILLFLLNYEISF